jgi:virginiamycin B lyase
VPTITTFAAPGGAASAPSGIIAAAGEVWFTAIADGTIGRVRRDGTVEVFADPAGQVRLPANIFPGADGRVWFTSLGTDRLGAIDPAADRPGDTIETYALPAGSRPVALKSAPDGRLWFTLRGANAVASADPADPEGTLQVHEDPSIAGPGALFIARDGRVWWVNGDSGALGVLDPATGAITAHGPWPGLGAPRAWAEDADGRLWLTTREPAGLLSFDPAEPDTSAHAVSDPRLVEPDGVCLSVDGALWLVDSATDAVVRYDPATDAWSSTGTAPDVSGPFDIKPGDHGALWFTNKTGGTIGRVTGL